MKLSSFLSGQKNLLSPARKMIAALFLFSALGATAMGAGTLSTTNTIVYGDVSPTIVVTLLGDTFTAGALATNNWTIDVSQTELTVGSITEGDVSSTEVKINFIGAKTKMSTLSIRALAGAVSSTEPTGILSTNVAQKVLTVTATADNKIYDTTSNATITVTATNGVLSPDDVSVTSLVGLFAQATVGNDISVTALLELTGDATLNYSLTQPTGLKANITAGPASNLVFTTQPSPSTTSLVAFAQQPQVTIQDQYGNTVTTATDNVVLTLAVGTGTLGGTKTVAAVSGVATFSGLNIDKVGADKKLAATSGLLNASTSSVFAITPAAANHLAFTTQPSPSTVKSVAFAQQPVVEIRDASSNLVTTATDAITLTKTTGTGTLGGMWAMLAVDGVADFTGKGLNIDQTGDNKELTATAGALTTDTTDPFTITDAANKLAFTIQPSDSTVAGMAFARQPVVTIQDEFGSTVVSATNLVTLTLTTGTGTLGGDVSVAAVSGVATFSGLSIDKVGADKKLAATSGSLNASTSSVFAITPAAASHVEFTTQPSASTVAGVEFARQPVVTIRDEFGNTVESTANVVLTLPAGAGTLSGTANMDAVAGVATFSGLSIDLVGDNKVLTATVGLLTTDTTDAFAITAAAASHVVFTTQPSPSTLTNMVFTNQPVVEIRDAFSNLVTTATSNVVLTLSQGIGTLGGTTNMNAVAGVAAFTNLSIDKAGTNKVLTATVTGLTTADTAPEFAITLSPDPVSLDFLVIYGETPADQTFALTVPADVSPTDYLLGTNRSWLSVADAGGDVSGTVINGMSTNIVVTVSTNGLHIGSTNGTISIGAGWLDVVVNVNYKLKPEPTNVTFNVRYGDTAPVTNNFVLTVPADVSPTDYLLVTNRSWLSVADAGGDVSGTVPTGGNTNITVVILPSELSVGGTNGTITVGSDWLNVAVNVTVDRGIDTTITFSNTNQVYDGTARPVLATSEHADDVSVTYVGNSWAPTNAGTYAVTGVVSTLNWMGTNSTTLTVEKADQAITFAEITDKVVGDTVTLSASASSDLPVSFTNTSGPAVIWTSVNTLTLTDVGAVSIVASQAGDGNYNTAETVTRSFNVAGKAAQTITFAEIPDQVVSDEVTLSATASSGLTVMFSADGPAVIAGNQLTFTGVGTVSIVASQAGDDTWAAATPVTRTFNVAQAAQTITFAEIADQAVGSVVTLGATASSGLTVSYGATGPAVITGSQLAFTGTGAVSIVASQSGNANWNAATSVTRTFNVGLNRYAEGDFDGDGLADPYWPMKDDVPGLWTIWLSEGGAYLPNGPYAMSVPGGVPIRVADFDGDGLADPVMVADGKWYIWLSSSGGEAPKGPSFTMPVPSGAVYWVAADFDGDGKADPAMVVNGNWTFWFSEGGYHQSDPIEMSVPDGEPVAADFDGDRKADPAMVANGNWTFWFSEGGYYQSDPIEMSVPGADPVPMVGDYDGDRKADPAMVVNNNWTFWLSGGGYLPVGPFQFAP